MSRLDYKFKEISFDPAVMDAIFSAPEKDGGEEGRAQERQDRLNADMRKVRRVMRAGLTPRQRECLTLYYLKGLDQWEIAARLGIHQTTVSQHIKYALEKLRRVLRANAPDAPMPAISLDRGWDS